MAGVEHTTESVQTGIAEVAKSIKSMEDQIKEVAADIKEATNQIKEVAADIKEATKEWKNCNPEHAEEKKFWQARLVANEARLVANEARLVAKEARLGEKEARLGEEKARLGRMQEMLLKHQLNTTQQGDVEIVTREFMHLELEKLQETIKSEFDTERSENKSMSSANTQFAGEILCGNRVAVSESANRTAPSSSFSFDWTLGEDACTDAALKQLKTLMSLDQQDVELIDARGCTLRVNAARKASKGQLDGLITETHSSTFFGLARGGVEFKTSKAKFNVVQMQLETLGLSLVSSYGQGVALLGTDLCTQWTTFHFDEPNHILVTKFLDGQTALQAFQELLETCKSRFQSHAPALSSIPEHSALPVSSPFDQEQDLSGSIPPSEAENLKNFQFLQAHAAHLSKLHGCEVNAPSWVLQTEHSPPMNYAASQMFA